MSDTEIEVRWVAGEEEMRGAIAVREEVFCREQGVSRAEELDGRDEEARHVVALAPGDGQVIGTARVLLAGADAKIGRVAVERAWRHRGVASRMLDLTLDGARECGCTRARLAAQIEAAALYERAGFVVESEPFEEAGIMHVWMGLALTPQAH
jgi:predicted GNAT family N-acyltransferase